MMVMINRSFGIETKKVAMETYDRLTAYKPLHLHFDEVLKNSQDKLAGSAYGFGRGDIREGLPIPGSPLLTSFSLGINTYLYSR